MVAGERARHRRHGERTLAADLAQAGELIASAQQLAAIAEQRALPLADVRRATIARLAAELVDAADAVDAALLGWAASELDVAASDNDPLDQSS